MQLPFELLVQDTFAWQNLEVWRSHSPKKSWMYTLQVLKSLPETTKSDHKHKLERG